MMIDLTGITNENEFYIHHYLSENIKYIYLVTFELVR